MHSRDVHVFVDIRDVLLQVLPDSGIFATRYTDHAQTPELEYGACEKMII